MLKTLTLYYKGELIRTKRCTTRKERLKELKLWRHLYGYKIWQAEVTVTPITTEIESQKLKYHEYLLSQMRIK